MSQPAKTHFSDDDLELRPLDAAQLRAFSSALKQFTTYLVDEGCVSMSSAVTDKLDLPAEGDLGSDEADRVLKTLCTISNAISTAYKKHQHVAFFYRLAHGQVDDKTRVAYCNDYIKSSKSKDPRFPTNHRNKRSTGFLKEPIRKFFEFVLDEDKDKRPEKPCSWGTSRLTQYENAYQLRCDLEAQMQLIGSDDGDDSPVISPMSSPEHGPHAGAESSPEHSLHADAAAPESSPKTVVPESSPEPESPRVLKRSAAALEADDQATPAKRMKGLLVQLDAM